MTAAGASPRRYDAAESKARIADAAIALFATRGYEATTAEITTRAGVAVGSLFYYFHSKRGLLDAVGRSFGERLVAAMQGEDRLEDLGPESNVRRCFAFYETNAPWSHTLRHDNGATPLTDGEDQQRQVFMDAARKVIEAWVAEQMRASIRHRGIIGIDPDITAALMFCVVREALAMGFRAGQTLSGRAHIEDQCVRFARSTCGYA